MIQTSSFKLILRRFTFPLVALPLLAMASGCAGGGYDAWDMLSKPVAAGGQAGEASSGGAASVGRSSGGSASGGSQPEEKGTDESQSMAPDDAVTVPVADLVEKTAPSPDSDLTIEQAETRTSVETDPLGELYVSRLHSMTVRVESRGNGARPDEGPWELVLGDGMRVAPLCMSEPSEPGIARCRYDFFHESEQPFAGACLERGSSLSGMPFRIGLDEFVSKEAASSDRTLD